MYNLLEFFKLRTLVILQETYQEESDFIHRRNSILYDTLVYTYVLQHISYLCL